MSLSFDSAVKNVCVKLRSVLLSIPDTLKAEVREIRLRVNRPVVIVCRDKTFFVLRGGHVVDTLYGVRKDVLISIREDIDETMNIMSEYSLYTHQSELKNGFITVVGGHRIGICGTAVVLPSGEISFVRDITSLNIRIARSIDGCGEQVVQLALKDGKRSNVLVIGVPSSGKTTVLRDAAKTLSMRYGKKVAVIDERSEIFGSYVGMPMDKVGMCDVLNGYPKDIGITQAIRVLSPDYIVCDEIGTREDIEAIGYGMHSGVSIIASVHAENFEELRERFILNQLLDMKWERVELSKQKSSLQFFCSE